MIEISKLSKEDIGRKVVFLPRQLEPENGVLTSWNDTFVFVQFKGPCGEACNPSDVGFIDGRSFEESYAAIRAAGGNAWDDVPDVANAVAEMRGIAVSVEECTEQLVAAIDCIEDSRKRCKAIEDVRHRLEFERRWNLLSKKQLDHMLNTSLTKEQRKALDAASSKSAKAFDALVADYARNLYFRRAAWVSYLNGEGDPPIIG